MMNDALQRIETDFPEVRGKVVAHGRHLGIRWVITYNDIRGFEACNGYCQLPEGSPWLRLHYDDIPVEVHGGLTYGPDEKRFVGFDTAHAWDEWSYEALAEAGVEIDITWRQQYGLPPRYKDGNQWNIQRMKDEVERLAFQIALEHPKSPS
jgi:hypothetical protein